MARKPSARVVLNRAALDQVTLAVADGLAEFSRTVVEEADPPDATPFGVGLVTGGGYLVYVDGKKVDGWSQDGRQPKPPRAAQVSRGKGAVAIFGWEFPARFQERGTIHHAPQPFAQPSLDRVMPQAAAIMAPAVAAKLPGKP